MFTNRLLNHIRHIVKYCVNVISPIENTEVITDVLVFRDKSTKFYNHYYPLIISVLCKLAVVLERLCVYVHGPIHMYVMGSCARGPAGQGRFRGWAG